MCGNMRCLRSFSSSYQLDELIFTSGIASSVETADMGVSLDGDTSVSINVSESGDSDRW